VIVTSDVSPAVNVLSATTMLTVGRTVSSLKVRLAAALTFPAPSCSLMEMVRAPSAEPSVGQAPYR